LRFASNRVARVAGGDSGVEGQAQEDRAEVKGYSAAAFGRLSPIFAWSELPWAREPQRATQVRKHRRDDQSDHRPWPTGDLSVKITGGTFAARVLELERNTIQIPW